jgi:hypothetical protein
MGGATAPHPPQAFHDIALRAITRPAIEAQMRMGRSDLIHSCSAMPGGIIHSAHHLRQRAGRIRARHGPEMGDKGRWQPRLFAGPGLGVAPRRLLEPTRRPLPWHQMECRHTLDLSLILPCPHPGPVPLPTEGGVERRDEGNAGCVLAQQHARPFLGFVFT